jgi:hypothetical protein
MEVDECPCLSDAPRALGTLPGRGIDGEACK